MALESLERDLQVLPAQALDPKKVAVILNRNARRVTDRIYRRMSVIAGRDNVYYCQNLDDAERFAREIVQRGYGTVVTGGGDGTLSRAVNLVSDYIAEANRLRLNRYHKKGEFQSRLVLPRFVPLKLGTGNGLREVVGSSDPIRDLRSVVNFLPGRTQSVSMLRTEDGLSFFGGLGYDSMILDDYNSFRAELSNPLLKPLAGSIWGYAGAIATRTLPRMLRGGRPQLQARVTTKEVAYYVDPRRGDRSEVIAPGTVLYEGPANMIAAGTTPYYGYGFRVFPFAGIMPGTMNLRIVRLGPVRAVLNLFSLWRGHYRSHRGIQDFLATDVEIELDRPFPFQQSGDPQGQRDKVRMSVAPETVELVDLYQHRRLG